jgi:predicted Zn-ribbon and HTH transcriptional regulator
MCPDPTRNQRTGENVKDWYQELGLTPAAELSDIDAAIERKSRQASAIANTAPDRSQQIRDLIRAMRSDLLSGPVKRREYDERLIRSQQSVAPRIPESVTRPVERTQVPTAPTPQPPVLAQPSSSGATPTADVGRLTSRFRQFLQSGWTCPSCRAEGMPEDKFCKKCGATMKPEVVNVKPRCANCGTENGVNDKFCSRCGATAP